MAWPEHIFCFTQEHVRHLYLRLGNVQFDWSLVELCVTVQIAEDSLSGPPAEMRLRENGIVVFELGFVDFVLSEGRHGLCVVDSEIV